MVICKNYYFLFFLAHLNIFFIHFKDLEQNFNFHRPSLLNKFNHLLIILIHHHILEEFIIPTNLNINYSNINKKINDKNLVQLLSNLM